MILIIWIMVIATVLCFISTIMDTLNQSRAIEKLISTFVALLQLLIIAVELYFTRLL